MLFRSKKEKKGSELIIYTLFTATFASVTGMFAYDAYASDNLPLASVLLLNSLAVAFSFAYSTAKQFLTKKEHNQEVKDANKHDSLTNLPNAFEFRNMINSKLSGLKSEGDHNLRAYYITIGLDKFKMINDIFGYKFADEVMVMVSEELRRAVDEDDILGRLQGDEFGIVTFQREEDFSGYIVRINDCFHKLYKGRKETGEVFVSAKMGISAWGKKMDDSLGDIMKKSSSALVAAKSNNMKFKFYNHLLEKESKDLLDLENDLRDAVANNEIEVFFQPKTNCDGKVLSAEALARWHSKRTNGFIRPDIFIKAAEDIGLINELGFQIMEKSIQEVKGWNKSGYDDIVVAINVSTKQFTSDLPKQITKLLQAYNVNPKNVEIEITESALVNDKATSIDLLEKIKDTGVSIAIDDFGTGYSSLSYLVDFPLDVVKIDKSFCDKLREPQKEVKLKGEAVISTVIHLSHKLNCKVVAEGVEDKEQLNFLRQEKCDLIQGYYFSPPLNKDKFFAYLKEHG